MLSRVPVRPSLLHQQLSTITVVDGRAYLAVCLGQGTYICEDIYKKAWTYQSLDVVMAVSRLMILTSGFILSSNKGRASPHM